MLSNMNMLDVHRMSKRNGSFMKSEALRLEANNFFHERNYFSAIELYNKALHLTPYSHVLWANKSAALMRQRHDGDIYEALRCAYRSFCLHEGEKSCFRIMRNLMDFRRYEQVQEWLEYVKITPFANSMFESPSVRKLMEELEKAKQHPPISNGKFVNIHNYHLSQVEKDLRNHAYDYKIRFAGHCNTTTDIKEAVFVGGRWGKPEFVAAGSDDGSIFIWDTDTTNIVRVLKGDSSIVNCIAPHVEMPILATSGIDNVVRIWEPRRSAKSDKNASEARRGRRASSDAIGQEVTNIPNAAETNAQRMARDPLDQVFLQFQGERDDNQPPIVNCRSQ